MTMIKCLFPPVTVTLFIGENHETYRFEDDSPVEVSTVAGYRLERDQDFEVVVE